MKKLVLFLSILLVYQAKGQQKDSRFESVVDKFEQHYSNGVYDSIYALFSSSMQQHLPLAETRKFFAGLKMEAGEIFGLESVNLSSTQATYKTTFERGIFALNVTLDSADKISGFLIKPYFSDSLPTLKRNVTVLKLPFRGSWTVLWGGDTPDLNHHAHNLAQKNGFDFFIKGDNKNTYKTDGRTNEDYYAFGKEIIAPCEAEVVMVVDGIKDNQPGEINPIYIPGNTVILKTAAGEHLVLAHFKQHSIVVRPGQKVKQGQLLGLCGNSGNSTEPHLHFHLQNVEEMYKATGAKMHFDKVLVNGELRIDYSPVKGDVVRYADD